MLLSKLFKASASIAGRLNKTKGLVYSGRDKRQKYFYLAKLLSYAVLGSTTIVGFSLYTIGNSKISCDVVDICSETKILRQVEDVNLEEKITEKNKIDYSDAINKSRDLLQRLKDEVGAPGIVVGVSVDGEVVWEEGIGYSDVENRIPCSRETVMRIGSISKSITMCAVAKLWEQGKLDLDKPLQDYLPYYPVKTFDGKPVSITCRQLVSHLGGIRHYINREENNSKNNNNGNKKKKESKELQEFDCKECYNKEFYKDIKSSLDFFKDDPLVAKPGSKFHYTTFGWTLISAIVEAASKEQFSTHVTKLFKNLGMTHTYLDLNDVLIYHRSRNYMKSKTGLLVNAPYVDNSYKYAGGGFLSTVGDLLNFGNGMLYSFQFNFEDSQNFNESYQISEKIETTTSKSNSKIQKSLPGYLNSKTIDIMWSPITDTKRGKYGMGWEVFPEKYECQFCEKTQFCVLHTGAAVGASSVLLILPKKSQQNLGDFDDMHLPKGTVVAILANLQAVGLYKLGLGVAKIFNQQSLSH